MLRRACIGAVVPLLLLAGCGNSRTSPPDFSRSAAPNGFAPLSLPASGVRLVVPNDWHVAAGQAPLVLTVSSGRAVLAVWRYPRTKPAPATDAILATVRTALIDAARTRDPSLRVIRSRLLTVDGARAIELDAVEQIAGQTRRVRSLHVYGNGAELVLDEYAPTGVFHTVDHQVFSPVKRSLQVFAVSAA